jgi:hypothetical protein
MNTERGEANYSLKREQELKRPQEIQLAWPGIEVRPPP